MKEKLTSLERVKRFCDLFASKWAEFVSESPWTDDEFLVERVPLAVTVRYGQNAQVCYTDTDFDWVNEECKDWKEVRRWKCIRYVTMALATHITYVSQFAFKLCRSIA